MFELEEIIREVMIELARDFVDSYDRLGFRATGNWERALEVQVDAFSGRVIGEDYTIQLVNGRAPGAMPPIEPLENWVQVKLGIPPEEANSVAWAVATKIRDEGTTVFIQGGSDLVDAVLTPDRIEESYQRIGAPIVARIVNEIQDNFRQR